MAERVNLLNGEGEDPSKPLENAVVETEADNGLGEEVTRINVQPKLTGDGEEGGEQEEPAAGEKPAEEPGVLTNKEATKVVSEAGLDMDQLAQEWQANGSLSEESYKALAEKGISKETVDAYVKGQQALADKYTSELTEYVGGKETFDGIFEWAAEKLSAPEKAAANYALASGDPEAAKLVLDGLKARYEAANGHTPGFINGGTAPVNSGVTPFGSAAEMSKAMRDARYRDDPAYRKQVYQRIQASSF